jgi:hypothetical protein
MHGHFARLLRDESAPQWVYKGKQAGDDGSATYSYRVIFKVGAALDVTATIAKDGKVAYCDTTFD